MNVLQNILSTKEYKNAKLQLATPEIYQARNLSSNPRTIRSSYPCCYTAQKYLGCLKGKFTATFLFPTYWRRLPNRMSYELYALCRYGHSKEHNKPSLALAWTCCVYGQNCSTVKLKDKAEELASLKKTTGE